MPFGRKRAGLDSKLKLFSLDLHFAVIADVKHTLRAIYGRCQVCAARAACACGLPAGFVSHMRNGTGSDVHVTDWLLYHQCPSKYGFQKPARSCDDLKASEAGAAYQTLNNITWYAIDQGMVDRWVWTYRAGRNIVERNLLLSRSHHPRRGVRLTEMPMPHRTCEIRRIHRYALACIRTSLRACEQANHTRQQLQIRKLQRCIHVACLSFPSLLRYRSNRSKNHRISLIVSRETWTS